MCLKELKSKTPISETDGDINAVTHKRMENDRPRRDKGMIGSCWYCGIAGEDTDEGAALHTDSHTRNVAVATILLEFANNEIRVKNLRR